MRKTHLVVHIVSQMAQGVALLGAQLIGDVLVAASEAHRLKGDDSDLVGVVDGKLNDRSDLIVVDAVDHRDDKNHVNSCSCQVLNRAELDVKKVAYLTVRVGRVGDAVKLQVTKTEACLFCAVGKVRIFSKRD